MARWFDADRIRDLQVKALASGGKARSLYDGAHSRLVEWDIAGDCTAPVLVEINGRPLEYRGRTLKRPRPLSTKLREKRRGLRVHGRARPVVAVVAGPGSSMATATPLSRDYWVSEISIRGNFGEIS